MGGRRRFRACSTRLLVVVVALMCLPMAAWAAPEDDLEEAQTRANRAAAELAEAETEVARAQDAVTHVQARVDAVDARVGATRERVRDLAIRLYVGGAAPVLRILRMADANDVVRAQQYSHVVAAASTDALQQLRADREDLRREQADLERRQESHAETLDDHRARQAEAVGELDRLTEVAARAAAEEAERREAEGRAASAPATAGRSEESSSSGQPTAGPLTATPSPAAPAASAPTTPNTPATPTTPTTPTRPTTTAVPTTTPPPEPEAPEPADWICPVQGPHAFSDDYGAPRGGGFSHQGNDILAARGTPVVASVDGEVRHRSGAVSGLAYYLDGDDGNEYFGAHLDEYGASGRVSQGTVVGYVGNTGDAASTAPHLHFEIHPGGRGYENPYPTLTRYC